MLNTLDNHPRLQKFILSGIMAASLVGLANNNVMAAQNIEKINSNTVATQMVKESDFDNKFYEAELNGHPLTSKFDSNPKEDRTAIHISREEIYKKFENQFLEKYGPRPAGFSVGNLAFHGNNYANREQFKNYVGDAAKTNAMIQDAKMVVKGADFAFRFTELNFKNFEDAANFEGKIVDMQNKLPANEKAKFENLYNDSFKRAYRSQGSDSYLASPTVKVREWVYNVNEATVKQGGDNIINQYIKAEVVNNLFKEAPTSNSWADKISNFKSQIFSNKDELKAPRP